MKRQATIVLTLMAMIAGTAAGHAAGTVVNGPDTGMANMLIGQDAFGGWQENRPGVWRTIEAGDLPAPFATKSASNAPSLVPRPADVVPQVPPGFKAELVASGLDGPREMALAPNGDVFVSDSGGNQIIVLRMVDGQAKPKARAVFASGLDGPHGLAFYPPGKPQWLYVGTADSVVRFPYHAGDMKASGPAQTIVGHLPTGGHSARDIAFSPSGATLYVSVGSASNVPSPGIGTPPGGIDQWASQHPLGEMWGTEEGRATLTTFAPDGSQRHILATGLRNCAGLAVEPTTGDPWCVVNERDGLGDNAPFDYATSVRDGNFYGWPWYYIGANADPRKPMAGQRPDLADQVTVPDVLFQAHSAPIDIAFYHGSQFPADYTGDAFVTLHGSWNRAQRTGYKVVRLKFNHGLPSGAYEDFVTGFVVSTNKVWGRPTGLVVAHDGSLLLSEDGSGTIWRIAYEKAAE